MDIGRVGTCTEHQQAGKERQQAGREHQQAGMVHQMAQAPLHIVVGIAAGNRACPSIEIRTQ